MKNDELQDVLNRGNGIALICTEISCPNCDDKILIEIGSHCGYDATIDNPISTHCYKCYNPITIDLNKIKYDKSVYMTISDFGKLF